MILARRCAAPLPLLLLLACALDERELRPKRSAGGQNASDDSATTSDEASGSAEPGAEEPNPGVVLVDGCADLDTDGEADCMATLVTTPAFEKDVEGWSSVDATVLSWDEKNASSEEVSGSAKLSGRLTTLRAMQCVPISGKQVVIAYASAFVETEDEDDDGTRALVEVSFFSHDDCSGESEGLFETPPSNVTHVWTTVQAGGISNKTTKSVSIALVAVKADPSANDAVYFDNVMLKMQDP